MIPQIPAGDGPIYMRLYRQLREMITQETWTAGMRIPSTRVLADQLGVSRNTATVAIDQLVADGYASARPGAGVFVAFSIRPNGKGSAEPDTPADIRTPALFEIAPERPETEALSLWRDAQRKAWRMLAADGYPEVEDGGDARLRRAISRMLHVSRGVRSAADQVIITSSCRAALDRCLSAMLVPGDEVFVEHPGDPAVRAMIAARGLKVVPVPIDDAGFDIDRALEIAPTARVAYVTPATQFPTCVEMRSDRRDSLARWAMTGGGWIIEDDRDCGRRYRGPQCASPLAGGSASDRTIYISSFNRTLLPGLGIAFAVVPRSLASACRHGCATGDCVSLPSQIAMLSLIEDGHWGTHLQNRHALHLRRRELLLEHVRPFLGTAFKLADEGAGGHVLLHPVICSTEELMTSLGSEGLRATVLSTGMFAGPRAPIALNFAAYSESTIVEAGPRLSRALIRATSQHVGLASRTGSGLHEVMASYLDAALEGRQTLGERVPLPTPQHGCQSPNDDTKARAWTTPVGEGGTAPLLSQ